VLPVPNATVTPSGSVSICQGNTITLIAGGGTSYLWNNSSTAGSLLVGSAGSYYVIASNGSCADTSAAVSVTVNALPSVGLSLPQDTFCINQSVATLSGGSPAGGTFSGTAVSGNTFDPFTAGMGMHYITYTFTDINGCTGSTTDSILVDGCMGVETSAAIPWSLFPNPTNGELTINTPADIPTAVLIEVYSADGKLIASESKQQASSVTLDMTGEAVGVYVIRITANGNVSMHRVVKM
jgi:hypothetical protein